MGGEEGADAALHDSVATTVLHAHINTGVAACSTGRVGIICHWSCLLTFHIVFKLACRLACLLAVPPPRWAGSAWSCTAWGLCISASPAATCTPSGTRRRAQIPAHVAASRHCLLAAASCGWICRLDAPFPLPLFLSSGCMHSSFLFPTLAAHSSIRSSLAACPLPPLSLFRRASLLPPYYPFPLPASLRDIAFLNRPFPVILQVFASSKAQLRNGYASVRPELRFWEAAGFAAGDGLPATTVSVRLPKGTRNNGTVWVLRLTSIACRNVCSGSLSWQLSVEAVACMIWKDGVL